MKYISKLSWIINSACNLRCVHCYPSSGIETKKDFNEHEFDTLYANLKDVHFKRVFISGGEPILDKNIVKYIQIASKVSDEVFICSNGFALTDSVLQKLKENGVKGIVLSLQSIDEKSSLDIYGNKNVFSLVMDAIQRVKKYGFILSVEITMMKKNFHFIEDIVNLLISKDITSLSFKRLLPVGRGENDEIHITKEENYRMLNKIADWQVQHSNITFNVHDPLYATILFDRFKDYLDNPKLLNWIKGFSCRAGTRWIGIGPQGDVSPCPILLYKGVVVGNVMENNLKDILDNSSIIHLLQDIEDNPGNVCKYGAVCLGCRATAISKQYGFFSKDPMCFETEQICPICSKMEKFNADYS